MVTWVCSNNLEQSRSHWCACFPRPRRSTWPFTKKNQKNYNKNKQTKKHKKNPIFRPQNRQRRLSTLPPIRRVYGEDTPTRDIFEGSVRPLVPARASRYLCEPWEPCPSLSSRGYLDSKSSQSGKVTRRRGILTQSSLTKNQVQWGPFIPLKMGV